MHGFSQKHTRGTMRFKEANHFSVSLWKRMSSKVGTITRISIPGGGRSWKREEASDKDHPVKRPSKSKIRKNKKKRPDRKSLSHFPILLMKGKKHELWKFLSSHPGGHCQKRQQAILKQLWMLREAVKNHKLFEKHRDHKIK